MREEETLCVAGAVVWGVWCWRDAVAVGEKSGVGERLSGWLCASRLGDGLIGQVGAGARGEDRAGVYWA